MSIHEWNSPESFELFFREHHVRMVLYAVRLVENLETARDIVQDVFLKTWENREKIEINTSLPAYLFVAIRNQCANYIRHQSIKQNFSNETQVKLRELEINYYGIVEEQNQQIFEEETSRNINKIISSMPEKCRQIFEMSRFEGLKSSDIAKKMNISVRTVETQIYRALKKIKDAIELKK